MNRPVPIAVVPLGAHPAMAVEIHGWPEGAEMGIATVRLLGAVEDLRYMTPETAEKLATGILLAVRAARGESVPTLLDSLLEKKGQP